MHREAGDTSYTRHEPKRKFSWKFATIIVVVLVAATGSGFYLYTRYDSLPFSKTDIERVSFPLYYPYYPDEIPKAYVLTKHSFKVQNGGIVFYSLDNGKGTILVSEQAIPERPPDLAHIEGFRHATTPNGSDMAIGTTNGQPTALLLNDTTLITVTGLKNVPKETVFEMTRNMKSVSQN